MRDPFPAAFFGDADAAGVEVGDDRGDGVVDLARSGRRGESSARRSQADSIVCCRVLIGKDARRRVGAGKGIILPAGAGRRAYPLELRTLT